MAVTHCAKNKLWFLFFDLLRRLLELLKGAKIYRLDGLRSVLRHYANGYFLNSF